MKRSPKLRWTTWRRRKRRTSRSSSGGIPPACTFSRTTEESSPAWPEPPRPPEGSPNVLFFVLDDVGYGQLSSFGGLVETPVLDRLAANGLRYTNMHTTALCSPTRGCILTGRNHHSLGLASITETSTGYPGYNGILPFDSEMLLQKGYNTFCVGKWHLSPPEHQTPAGPYDRWPLGRGFERFYGFLGGDTNQWHPELVYDNHAIEQPKQPEDGYHLSIDLADKAIEFIQDAHVNAPDKPFFLYYATNAGHAPHHVPKEWADKYQGKFDMGWDEYRKIVHQRQLDMGIIPKGTELSAHDPGTVCDEHGKPRLIYPTPAWEDFVSLAVSEIRLFDASSIQVPRRLRVMLEHLIAVLPEVRAQPLHQELSLLRRAVERDYPDEEDRQRADTSDRQGIGGSSMQSRLSSG